MVTATSAVFDGPLSVIDPPAIAALREVFDRHGYTTGAAGDALGLPLPFSKQHLREDTPLYLRRIQAPTPLHTLVKLFILDLSVDETSAAEAFAPMDLDAVRKIGLIEDSPRGVKARLRLSMYDDLLVAHDAHDHDKRTLRPDHVLDVNPTTISLSNLTVRRRVPRALEIGTGCGALALRASRHADHVIGTDTNPRALNVAAFNAAINGITNVEWRLGSLFDAVDGEKFNLIFCNPPYVISPDSQFIFRDGGRRGDALCQELVQRAPAYLQDGGFATFLVNWVVRRDEDWRAPLRRWLEGNGCDSWFMLSAAQDPTTYAGIWTRSRVPEEYTAAVDRWTQYFHELQVATIGLGAVVLRKRATGTGWVRADHVDDAVAGPAGAHIERLFAAEDRLAALASDDALLDSTWAVAADQQIEQVLTLKNGRYAVHSAQVSLQGGLPFHGNVDAYAIQFLSRCDGRRTLRAIAEEIAGEAGVSVPAFTAAAAGIVRRLIAMGFLVGPQLEEGSVT